MNKPMEVSMTASLNSNPYAVLFHRWLEVVPFQYKGIDLSTCTEIKSELIEYAKKALKSGLSLYFYGEWGCGKTTLAYALVRHMLEDKIRTQYFWPRYFSAKEFDSLLLKGSKSEEGDSFILSEMSTHDLLFIDDIDKINPSERFKNQLFEIINARIINGKQTIITSNCAPTDISQIIDGAVSSRISDKSKWTVIKFPNGDLRKLNTITF